MEPVPPTQAPPVIIAQKTFPFKKILSIAVIIMLLSIASLWGYYFGTTKTKSLPINPPPMNTPTLSEADLPFSLKILKNPMVNQWAAGVEGKLIEKKDYSMTLQNKQGQTIIIPLKLSENTKMWTTFLITKKGEKTLKNASLDEIPIGAILVGEFFILPLHDDKNRTVGGQFVYNENSQELR